MQSGEEFHTPEAVFTYSDSGLAEMSQRFHKVIREHVCRGKYQLAERPVLINNWEATYFDFNEEKIWSIAKSAAELGVDMLVLDDGWFGKRDGDCSGLGDWDVNETKLRGVCVRAQAYIAAALHALRRRTPICPACRLCARWKTRLK